MLVHGLDLGTISHGPFARCVWCFGRTPDSMTACSRRHQCQTRNFFLCVVAAINAGDVEHVAEWFAEDFKLHEPGVRLLTGHEGARLMPHHLRTTLGPETRLEVLDMIEEGDHVAVCWQLSGIKDGQPACALHCDLSLCQWKDCRGLGHRLLQGTALAVRAGTLRGLAPSLGSTWTTHAFRTGTGSNSGTGESSAATKALIKHGLEPADAGLYSRQLARPVGIGGVSKEADHEAGHSP